MRGATNVAATDPDLDGLVERVIRTNRGVQERLRLTDVYLTRALDRLHAGEDPLSLFLEMLPIPREGSDEDPLKEYARARHDLRIAIISLCLDAGMSIGEVGRRYGFSRQLASRYAKEIRGETTLTGELPAAPAADRRGPVASTG